MLYRNCAKRSPDVAESLRKELLAFKLKTGGTGLVFQTSKGTPYSPDNVTKRDFAEALAAAEAKRKEQNRPAIGKVRWHDLRHTYGSLLLDQGETIFYVSRIMGRSSITVTADTYGHLVEPKTDAVSKVADMILEKPGESSPNITMENGQIQA